MEYQILGRMTRRAKLALSIMPSFISQLKLEKSRKPVFILFDHLAENEGQTEILEGTLGYLITIDKGLDLGMVATTLAHEMVHVKQMAKGKLSHDKNGDLIWQNKKQTAALEYLDRPWEIEAYSKQELLMRRAIQSLPV